MIFLNSPTVQQLGEGAELALHAFRLMAAGADASALVAAFDARLGPPGREALGAMHVLVHEIAAAGGRRLTIACPGCCRLTGDELSVLGLLAAAQGHDLDRMSPHVRCLLAGRASETAGRAALAFGGLLRDAGLPVEAAPGDSAAAYTLRVAGNA